MFALEGHPLFDAVPSTVGVANFEMDPLNGSLPFRLGTVNWCAEGQSSLNDVHQFHSAQVPL
jgi:hypothetical protein